MLKRRGTAHWSGNLQQGSGTVATQSGVVNAPYSFGRRFGNDAGTNPEELIAAAHAACYAMAFSLVLGEEGLTAESIDASATVHLDTEGAPTIRTVALDVSARIPGLDATKFQELAKKTKEFCPVSRLLTGAEITLTAKLV